MKRVLCTLWVLFTAVLLSGIALGQSTIYLEEFDSSVAPAFSGDVLSFDSSWKTSTSSSSPGSGLNNAVHTGTSPGALALGPVDLGLALSGTFSYYARRTSSYSADSLIVRASIDGGSAYDIVLFGGGLPAASSAWEQISVSIPDTLLGEADVRIQFDGRGGTSSGSNIRIDDVLFEGVLDTASIPASFGFDAASSTWNLSTTTHQADLSLSWPGPDSIRGFQFDLTWDNSLILVDSVSANTSVLPPSDWSISRNISSGTARIAALNLNSAGQLPGELDQMMQIHFSDAGAGLVADTLVSVDLSGLIVTSPSATGDELSLPSGNRSLALTLSPSQAAFSLSASSLDFGSVGVGDSVAVALNIFNTTGTGDLSLSYGASSLDAVTLPAPPSLIAAGESGVFNVWFKPLADEYGSLAGQFAIYHNAPGDSAIVSVSGVGTGGRGDADADGAFDVADVVLSLDTSVSLVAPSSTDLLRHDLYPFPAGDGQIDIRDVTVGIQAILFDEWPDGSALPVAPAASSPAQKHSPVRVIADEAGLWLESTIDLRGIQISIKAASSLSFVPASKSGGMLSEHFDEESETMRLVVVASKDEPIEGGLSQLAYPGHGSLEFQDGIGVGERGDKYQIVFESSLATSLESGDLQDELPRDEARLFPNPLRVGNPATLELGEMLRGATIRVFDLLGREIKMLKSSALSGQASIPADVFTTPGLYFIRIEAQERLNALKKATTMSIIAAR